MARLIDIVRLGARRSLAQDKESGGAGGAPRGRGRVGRKALAARTAHLMTESGAPALPAGRREFHCAGSSPWPGVRST